MLCEVAPAKLNLFLHITGKRADGFHLLQSLVVFLSVGDNISVEGSFPPPLPNPTPQEGIENALLKLEITGRFAPLLAADTKNNLVLKAARLLQEYVSISTKGAFPPPIREEISPELLLYSSYKGAHITLHKALPIGSGLGGGSADAAAALKALCALWELEIPPHALHNIAMQLGSDVPVCLHSTPALISGVGDNIDPVEFTPKAYVVLVHPGKALLTADVYRNFKNAFRPHIKLPPITSLAILLDVMRRTTNDLEIPAINLLPELKDILKAISAQQHCLISRMSGSGATCFGLFETQVAAHTASQTLQEYYPHAWVRWAVIRPKQFKNCEEDNTTLPRNASFRT